MGTFKRWYMVARLRGNAHPALEASDWNIAYIWWPPIFLVLHVSGNNIGQAKVGNLRAELKSVILWLKSVLQHTIIWSQILPRFSGDLKAMERCRYRLNNSIATFILGHTLHSLSRYKEKLQQIIEARWSSPVKSRHWHSFKYIARGLEQFLLNDWITTFPSM
jgi:hypothetical protein